MDKERARAEAKRVGERIRARRIALKPKMSLNGFAREVGVSAPTAWGWEHGKFIPRIAHLRRVSSVLRCDVVDLLGKRAA